MKDISFEFGINTIQLDSWEDFFKHINEYLEQAHFVWRGQANSEQLLEPTLDRLLKNIKKIDAPSVVKSHLKNFKYAIRGRRNSTSKLKNDNDWWAVGQHNGLYPPLLDWTKSPFIAAFFAFSSEIENNSENRVLFGISKSTFERKSEKILSDNPSKEIIEFIEPLSDENMRLINQGGLFTKTKTGIDIESWMKNNFNEKENKIRMLKFLIPNDERSKVLKSLNRMNINYSSLFPDIIGASIFVNSNLEITNY